ncbi:MAG: hypothetical protein K9H26_18120 [Prolixibacteraceae bacterium]|nr:hypothetical protein [Prolixibacteraceae bacterium]
MRKFAYIACMLLLLASCIDKYEGFGVKGDTELTLPIAYGSFMLGDLLKTFDEDSMFSSDLQNELMFSYKLDDVSSIGFNELVDLPVNMTLISRTRELGLIHLADTVYRDYIPLEELTERLSFVADFSEMEEGLVDSFDAVVVGSGYSQFLVWEIEDFDYLTEADINTGSLTVNLVNEFPVNCNVVFEFIDSEGTYIDEYAFGGSSLRGLNPGEQESFTMDLSGKSIKAPLRYKIKYLEFFESETAVYVDFSRGLNISVDVNGMYLNSGVFSAEKFIYESDEEQVAVELIDSVKLQKLVFQSGTLKLRVKKQFEADGTLFVNLPGLRSDDVSFRGEVPLEGTEQVVSEYDLSGMELNLNAGENPFNTLRFSFGFENQTEDYIELHATDTYQYSILIQRMKFSYIEGDFGRQKLNFSRTGITLNPEIWDMLGGEVFGSTPVLTVYFSNPIGIPVLYDFAIEATNRLGNSVRVDAAPYVMDYPENLAASPVLSEKVFTVENSNIMEFIQLPPNDTINFDVNLAMNPDGEPSPDRLNFVDMEEKFTVGIGFEVPILLRGLFFTFDDTLSLNTGNISGMVAEAKITFRTRNEIPLQVDFSAIPFDTLTNKPTGEALLVTLLDAAPTDEFGNVTGISETENVLTLSPDDFSNLQKANAVVIKASFLSPGEGTQPAKLRNAHSFDLKMILDVSPVL